MALKLVTAPASLPVTLELMREHLQVDVWGSPAVNPDDDLITLYMNAAVEEIDGPKGWLGRALMPQTWQLILDEFPASDEFIILPLPPLQSISSFQYYDSSNVQQSLTTYELDEVSEPARIKAPSTGWPATYDRLNAITIQFVCGYADAAAVPDLIKSYIKLRTRTLYDNRSLIAQGINVTASPFLRDSLEGLRVRSKSSA